MYVLKFRRRNGKGRVFTATISQREQVTLVMAEGGIQQPAMACEDMHQAINTVIDFFTRHQAHYQE